VCEAIENRRAKRASFTPLIDLGQYQEAAFTKRCAAGQIGDDFACRDELRKGVGLLSNVVEPVVTAHLVLEPFHPA